MNELELFTDNSIRYLEKFVSFSSYSHKEKELTDKFSIKYRFCTYTITCFE